MKSIILVLSMILTLGISNSFGETNGYTILFLCDGKVCNRLIDVKEFTQSSSIIKCVLKTGEVINISSSTPIIIVDAKIASEFELTFNF